MNKNWEVKKLGDVCEISTGKSNANEAVENGEYAFFDRSKTIKRSSRFLFDCEAIIIPGEGQEFMPRYYKGKFDLHQRAYAIYEFSKNIRIQFIYWYLIHYHKYFERVAVGATAKSLRLRHFEELPILIPPLPEQKRIVGILDEAFAAISKAKANAEKNLQNARELFESYLQGVFANPGKGWEEKKLGAIAKVIGGFSFKSTDFKKQGRYQVIRMGNVRPGIIRPKERPVFIDDVDDNVLKRALLLPNDVIITQTGTKRKRDYGFTAIIDKKNYLLNQRIATIRFSSNFLPKFFLYFSWTIFFKDQYFANETGTVGQGNVGISAITDARITFPPLAQQRSIVAKLDAFSAETKKLESIYQQTLADLEELKKSVLQKAFNGELAGACA